MPTSLVAVERTSGIVTTLRWQGTDTVTLLLCSDIHFDSPKCDRQLLKRHFDHAVDIGARIFIFGDWFDVMGTKSDRRMTKEVIRPEYQSGNYLDLVINDSANFLLPYVEAGVLTLIGEGNHESAIRKHQETDCLERLVEQLNYRATTSHRVICGGYEGWLRFLGQSTPEGGRMSKLLHYHHGYETGRRSKGVLAFDLDRARWHADIYVSGHNHEKTVYPTTREVLTAQGLRRLEKVLHLQLGTYKLKDPDDYGRGWPVEKKFTASVLGSYLLHLKIQRAADKRHVMVFKAEELDEGVW